MRQLGLIWIALMMPTLALGQGFVNDDKLKIAIEKTTDIYKSGQPIVVKLTITNVTNSVQSIEFTEFHKYHKTLPYPTCISASILDSNRQNRCKSGTQYVIWSTLFSKEDSKYLKIRPNDSIIRYLTVNEIAYDCDCYQDNGLKAGTYFISLGVHERLTNELKIEVR